MSGARTTYVIIQGVRRAYAAAALGASEVDVVLDSDGRPLTVPVGDLLSPRRVIDIPTGTAVDRYQSIAKAVAEGRDLPPIVVSPGTLGVPLAQVRLQT